MLEISINKCFALTFLTYEDKVTNLKCLGSGSVNPSIRYEYITLKCT